MINDPTIKSQIDNIVLIGSDPIIFMMISLVINSFDKDPEFLECENKIKESIRCLSKLVELIKSREPV